MTFIHRSLRAASTALAGTAFLLTPNLHAQTNQSFDVTLSLSASCTIGTISALNLGTYTAGQSTAATGSTTASISCPSGVSFTPNLVNSADANVASKTTIDAQTQLSYDLAIDGGATARTSAGTALTVTINGSIAGGQLGCSTDTCRGATANRSHTLRLTY